MPSRRSRLSRSRPWYVPLPLTRFDKKKSLRPGPQSTTTGLSHDRRFEDQLLHSWTEQRLTSITSQGTSDVRVDPQLNKKVWEQGVKGVPYRLRIRISRRRNDEEGAKEKLYSYVQAVNVKDPKGLQTVVVEE